MRFARPMRLIPAFLATLLIGVLAPTVTASAAVPVCADLQIGALSVSPATPIAGQQATVTVPVYNAGTCAAFGATVQWKITPYAASGPSKQITQINAGQTINVLLPYTFPKAGNFESTAKVDTKNVVSETNEKNNTQILPITVLAAGVDLSITSFSTAPSTPVPAYPHDPVQGRDEITTITVHNGGNTAAGPFQLKWVPKPFAQALTQQVSGLASNASQTFQIHYTYQQAGTFKSTATVDPTKSVKETNENNNTATLSVRVDPQRPDLIVDSVAIGPSPIIPGGLTTATITVKNIGNTDSPAFMLAWRPTPTSAPVSQQVNGIPAGGSAVVPLTFTFPAAGSFAGLITADSTKVVKEINENNNTLATNVVVEPNTVDLQIVGETITGSQQEVVNAPNFSGGSIIGTPTQGEPVKVDIQVKNAGNTHSGPFLVDWNPDATYVSSPSLQTVTQEVSDLQAGATTTVEFFFTYDVYGNFETLTTLDPRNTVTETNEANNQNILPITVVPAPIDLTGTMDVNPKPAVRGVAATNTVTVTNNGNFPASKPFTVQWFPTGSGVPQSKVVNGLSPGDTTTLTFTATYQVVPKGGTYDSKVVIDSGNAIPETDEANNTLTQTVTVVPQSADVTVSLDHLHALNNMEFSSCVPVVGNPYDCGSGEWGVVFLVFDPTQSCDVNVELGDSGDDFELKLPSVYCGYNNNNHDVDDNSDLTDHFPMNHTVHLVEQTPLVAGVGAVEEDFAIPDIPGFSTFIKSRSDYLSQSGLVSTPGQSCARVSGFPDVGQVTPVDDGHCFDAYWGVSTANVVGPSNSVMMHSTLKTNALNAADDTIDPSDGSYTQAQETAQINDAYSQIQAAAVAAAQQSGSAANVHISMHSSTVK